MYATLVIALFAPRIEKVLFAATKADHLHHTSHDRLAGVMSHLVARAASRAQGAGAKVEAMAFAAIRATREVRIREGREELPAIAGVPEAGEVVDGEVFDGQAEAAIFPGDLPERPEAIFDADAPRWQCGAGCPAGAQATSGPRHQQFRFQRYECLRIENNRACPELERLMGKWGAARWAVIGRNYFAYRESKPCGGDFNR